jgi:hypothetical protein
MLDVMITADLRWLAGKLQHVRKQLRYAHPDVTWLSLAGTTARPIRPERRCGHTISRRSTASAKTASMSVARAATSSRAT